MPRQTTATPESPGWGDGDGLSGGTLIRMLLAVGVPLEKWLPLYIAMVQGSPKLVWCCSSGRGKNVPPSTGLELLVRER
jgi:hypothetical protein